MKPEELHKRIAKQKKIAEQIDKGITSYTIENLQKFPMQSIPQAYKELLRPLVKDDQLLDILSNEQNMQKISNRLAYHATLIDNKNGNLATVRQIGKKTLTNIHKDFLELIEYGEEVEDNYQKVAKRLQRAGYDYSHKTNGNVHRIKLTITLTKG